MANLRKRRAAKRRTGSGRKARSRKARGGIRSVRSPRLPKKSGPDRGRRPESEAATASSAFNEGYNEGFNAGFAEGLADEGRAAS
ncbi:MULTISPECIES: hypothetical protein [Cohnella]|uniref:hypothetical protein n=1 Tax=Cohnella TaxID=329857 RepID=UPI0009BA6C8F|nr:MULTISPECIES: hypothetical protein [Cohnella]MBN2982670.1 hypothetical protein [Cohnella algarum]